MKSDLEKAKVKSLLATQREEIELYSTVDLEKIFTSTYMNEIDREIQYVSIRNSVNEAN